MDKFLTQEDIRNLKELNARLQNELAIFGIGIDMVPEALSVELDEYVEVQMCTGLSDMNAIKLREFYLTKKRQQLDQKFELSRLQTEVESLKKQIGTVTKECELLEKFVNNQPEAKDYQSAKSLAKKKLQGLQQRQQNIQLPEDISIEELIKKVDILKQREADGKK